MRSGGRNPASVTDTCGDINYYFADHRMYMVQLGITKILPPTRTFEGDGPSLVGEWSTTQLREWLKDNPQ